MKKLLLFIFLALISTNVYCQINNTKKNTDIYNNLQKIEKKKKEQQIRRREELRRTLVGSSTNSGATTSKQTNKTKQSQTTAKAKRYNCPACNGSGVYSLMPGDVMAPVVDCAGCQGRKTVTAQEYRQIVQSMAEVNRKLQPTRPKGRVASKGKCSSCGGSGRCSSCAGKGFRFYDDMYTGKEGIIRCSVCNQSGKCSFCNGSRRGY